MLIAIFASPQFSDTPTGFGSFLGVFCKQAPQAKRGAHPWSTSRYAQEFGVFYLFIFIFGTIFLIILFIPLNYTFSRLR
jgi:hypothetical protein